MKKILTSFIVSFLALTFISNDSVEASVKVVESYSVKGKMMYAFPNEQYINVYAKPSKNSKIIQKVKRNGAFMINAKMSNGWYGTSWFTLDNTFVYINPQDIMLVRENDTKNFPEPVYSFPVSDLSAPVPNVNVPPITSKVTDNTLDNIKTIVDTLGFKKQVSPASIDYYYYAPDGEIVRNGGGEAIEFHHIPTSQPRYGEFRLLIGAWDNRDTYTKGQIETVPAAIREILKFYFPTSYDKIYSMLYTGFNTNTDMEKYVNTMFKFDNRVFRVEVYSDSGKVGIYIGKEGELYTNSFTLPENVAIVKVNGTRIITNQPAIIENGTTIVPLRGIFEALGATVNWNNATRTITAHKGDRKVSLTIGNKKAMANGVFTNLSIPPKITNGTTLVPLRFISQALGANVKWDSNNKMVLIDS